MKPPEQVAVGQVLPHLQMPIIRIVPGQSLQQELGFHGHFVEQCLHLLVEFEKLKPSHFIERGSFKHFEWSLARNYLGDAEIVQSQDERVTPIAAEYFEVSEDPVGKQVTVSHGQT